MNAKKLKLDKWCIDLATGEVNVQGNADNDAVRIEPQGVQFLQVLAQSPHQLVSKEDLMAAIWQHTAVTDEALSRCVSRVRKALQDNAKQPVLVETLSKRGYRLIATDIQWLEDAKDSNSAESSRQPYSARRGFNRIQVLTVMSALIIVFGWLFLTQFNNSQTNADNSEELVARGDDYYAQIRRLDNEMAIELYQQALAIRPDSGAAWAGMANALVQQVIRWPNEASEAELSFDGIHQAILDGRTSTEDAKVKLHRAVEYAQKAVQLAPQDPRTHKALGLVLSAQSKFSDAVVSYEKAVQLNPDAWDALINIGGILENAGEIQQAVSYFELTFQAMTRVSQEQSVRVRPWRADMGAVVGETYLSLQQGSDAEAWFRHVLSFAPFNFRATKGLATVLFANGEEAEAKRLCEEYQQRAGEDPCVDIAL